MDRKVGWIESKREAARAKKKKKKEEEGIIDNYGQEMRKEESLQMYRFTD